MPAISFSRPNATEPALNLMVPVNGSVQSGTLLKIWGAAFSGAAPATPPLNPWDDPNINMLMGPFSESGGNWDIGSLLIPGDTSAGQVKHVVVWGVYDNEDKFFTQVREFTLVEN